LGEQGLILQYGEYEIGPYVVGLPRLVIPFSELQGVLKPEYLPKIDTPAASTLLQVRQVKVNATVRYPYPF
jgi:hypothetical protein